ncbi:MAG TPA: NADPH-dependent assimilatory sulfite reductase hemoprotein subunit [Methylophaga sp.]|nr:NADPH-dependent assimilatory sulfite reductase hemoprotein subunit [Methylophaga sp.]
MLKNNPPIKYLALDIDELHDNERVKQRSQFLRGTLNASLETVESASIAESDTLLTKFHGIYQQDDRDQRKTRRQRKLEPDYQFMVRIRIPGGVVNKSQWQKLDFLSRRYANRGLRITTRQTIQLHGVQKWHLRDVLQGLKQVGLDTIAACGDDSRGIVCGINPDHSAIHRQVYQIAQDTSDRLIPKTHAYKEVWYQKPADTDSTNEEPVYGPLYLPRKFKVGFVIPPVNDIDVFAQDVGFIAVIKNNQLEGFNVCVGGGMGQLDSRDDSYPRLASEIGFVPTADAAKLAEIIMTIQRDYGDRIDRHQARFKYTIDRLGINWFINELTARYGKALRASRKYRFTQNHDLIGWHKTDREHWQVTFNIDNGRISNALQDQFQALIQDLTGAIRLTPNQNLQLINIPDFAKTTLENRIEDFGLSALINVADQSAYSMSCVALPTCGLAMAEAERYMPDFLTRFENLKTAHDLSATPITLRVTGCPNGCARPYLGEIALTGRAKDLYNLYLGGSPRGDRLAVCYQQNVNENEIFKTLDMLLSLYKTERLKNEAFGDYLVRSQTLKTPQSSQQSLPIQEM